MRFWRQRDTKRQLTSISVSLTGATLSWEAQKTERRRAREVLHRLEDHRVLYVPHEYELVEPVLQSLERLRLFLRDEIPQCESVELRDGLREIQAAVRDFLDKIKDFSLWQGLELMRARVGAEVATIADTFGIPLDKDLGRITPEDLRRRNTTQRRSRTTSDD